VGGLAQNGDFFDQFFGRGVTIGSAFRFDIILAALQSAVDQQANILSGGLRAFPIACSGLFVLIVGIDDRLFERIAFGVTCRAWDLADFLQAREFGFDFSVAYDIVRRGQNGFGFLFLFGISGVSASSDASTDIADFRAVLIPFFRVQRRDDRASITFGQIFAEFASFGQHGGEPFSVFILHHASAGARVANARQMFVRHGVRRTSHSQNSQNQFHDY